MAFHIKHELDPVYETIFLLYHGYDIEKHKNYIIKETKETGGNGEEFYQKHYKTIDKYIQTFHKNRIQTDKDSFYFKDTSHDFYTSFITPFFLEKDFFETVGQLSNDQIIAKIIHCNEDIFEKELKEYSGISHDEFIKSDSITSYVNQFELNDSEKWKMLMILQNPKEHYGYFSDLVTKNIPAFVKSYEAVKEAADKYIEHYDNIFTSEDKDARIFQQLNLANCDIKEIIPSLVTASGMVIFPDTCYYGVLTDRTLDEFGYSKKGKDYLLTCLKALSDKSKLEILSTLRTSPKYAAELAAQLGITSATVSHHMNVLLAAQLVYLEKDNGKFYYHINNASMKMLLEELQQLLLS